MADAAAAAPAEASNKRRRLRDIAEGLGDLGSYGDLSLQLQPEDLRPRPSFTQQLAQLHERMAATFASWAQPPVEYQRRALLIIGLFLEGGNLWDSKSDMLLGQLVSALTHGELRAHSDAVRRYDNGARFALCAASFLEPFDPNQQDRRFIFGGARVCPFRLRAPRRRQPAALGHEDPRRPAAIPNLAFACRHSRHLGGAHALLRSFRAMGCVLFRFVGRARWGLPLFS